jgi:hypothetical protein
MITKQQVQKAIEVLKRTRKAYSYAPMVYIGENPVPDGETRLSLQTYDYGDWKPVFEAHPELRDAFTLVAMASFPPNHTGMPLEPFRKDASGWLDFYASLPPDVLDTNPPLGRHALIRNIADEVFHKIFDDDGKIIDTGGGERLLSVMANPPPMVHAGGAKARALHDMLFGALAYPLLPESERDAVLKRVADATEHFIRANGTDAIPQINGSIFTKIAYPIEFLPIVHVLDSAVDDLSQTGISKRYFTDLLPGSHLSFNPTWVEQAWIYQNFAPLFDEGLRDLFARREFSHESVHAVLHDGFGALADSAHATRLKRLFEEIWKNGYPTTFYGLMAVFSHEYPERSMRIARLAAKTVSKGWNAMVYARLALGRGTDRDSEMVKFVSEPMRDAAKMSLPFVYQRVFRKMRSSSPKLQKQRGEFARLTASTVIGIETDHIRHYYPEQMWIDLWEGFHDMLTNPSELLKDPQKMAAYRNARENVFEDGWIYDLCGEGGGELL